MAMFCSPVGHICGSHGSLLRGKAADQHSSDRWTAAVGMHGVGSSVQVISPAGVSLVVVDHGTQGGRQRRVVGGAAIRNRFGDNVPISASYIRFFGRRGGIHSLRWAAAGIRRERGNGRFCRSTAVGGSVCCHGYRIVQPFQLRMYDRSTVTDSGSHFLRKLREDRDRQTSEKAGGRYGDSTDKKLPQFFIFHFWSKILFLFS